MKPNAKLQKKECPAVIDTLKDERMREQLLGFDRKRILDACSIASSAHGISRF